MSFQFFSGPASAFPPNSTWKDFITLFNINKPTMLQTGDSGEDVGRIFNAISDAAKNIGVEERVILCIIMQESRGNVGADGPKDQDGNTTGGLMQAEESPGFPGQHDLSQDQINAMVNAGTRHFKGDLQQLDDADTASTIYRALRLYNSGSINESDLSDGKGATALYVSDIANRLQGRTNG